MLIIIVLIIYGVLIYRINKNLESIIVTLDEVVDDFKFMYEEAFGFPPTSDEERVTHE